MVADFSKPGPKPKPSGPLVVMKGDIPDKEFNKKAEGMVSRGTRKTRHGVGRRAKTNPTPVEKSKIGTKAFRAKMNKQQIKHNPKAPVVREARAPGSGIPKQGFTKAQFTKIYGKGGTTRATSSGGGSIGGMLTTGTGTFGMFKPRK